MAKKHKNLGNTSIPDYTTLKEIIVKGAERGGDKKQYGYLDKNKKECELTFNQVWRLTCGIGTYFRSQGLTGGKKIAIISENCIEWIIVYYATLVGGNITVPMDCKLPYDDLADQLIRCDCDALIYSEKFSDAVEQFKSNPAMPVKYYFNLSDFDACAQQGIEAFDAGDKEFVDVPVKPEDLACIVYTSGTTGKSKGVMLSHLNIASNCSASCRVLSGGFAIGFLPLNHTFAWVGALFASFIVCEGGYLCDSVKDIASDLKKQKPYNFSAVPLVVETIYDRIWKTARKSGKEDVLKKGLKISRFLMKLGIDKRRDIFKTILDNLGGNLSMIICGGANLDPKYEQGLYDFGIDVFNGYGTTECSPAVTCNKPDKFKFGSVGTPIECNEIKIHEPDEEGVGEIYVRGSNVMLGYYGEPEATAAVFDGDWYKTGDYGRIDEDGFLFMVGRKKNLIVLSNGKNVSPEELEYKLTMAIEYINEVLVYDEDGAIVAEFFLNTEEYPDAKERIRGDVTEFNRHMPIFKNIGKIKTRDEEFPKTTTLKIMRKNYNK